MPREGHLCHVLQIFAYLDKYHNAELVLNPSDPTDMDMGAFERRDWTTSEFGHLEKEEAPPNAPAPRGFGFVMHAKVDADHATDTATRRSRTGFLV